LESKGSVLAAGFKVSVSHKEVSRKEAKERRAQREVGGLLVKTRTMVEYDPARSESIELPG